MTIKVCPECGSDDVQEFVAGWVDANDWDAPVVDLDIAEMYSVTRWCAACSDKNYKEGDGFYEGCGFFDEIDREAV